MYGKESQEPSHPTEVPRGQGTRCYGYVARATEGFQTSGLYYEDSQDTILQINWRLAECFIKAEAIVSSDGLLPSTVWV